MNSLNVIEKNNQRVLTSYQLAEVFGTKTKDIVYNFNYNKHRYTEGKHYFVLTGQERRDFLNETEIPSSYKKTHTIYLWTQKGAFMHAKSLGTDKAWAAYESLVDDYFAKVEQIQRANIPTSVPTTIEGILELAVLNMKDLRSELNAVKEENRKLSLIVDNSMYIDDHQKGEIQDAVCKRVGELMKIGYDPHFQSIYRALKSHFTVPKYDKILMKDFPVAIDLIKGWYPRKNEQNA